MRKRYSVETRISDPLRKQVLLGTLFVYGENDDEAQRKAEETAAVWMRDEGILFDRQRNDQDLMPYVTFGAPREAPLFRGLMPLTGGTGRAA